MPDVSIAISAKDNFSSTLKKIANETRIGSKSIENLQESLTKLNNTKVNVQTNLDKVKDELKEAKKNFLEFGDAASEAAYKTKQEEFNNLSASLRAVNSEAKAAERSLQDLSGTNSKIMNRADTTGSLGGEGASYDGGTDLLSRLAKAGLGKMLVGSVQGMTNSVISSALGDTAGSAVSSMLGGALEGAVIGSIVPGVGTVAGAIVGLASGGITAVTQAFEKEDDAFRSYVQEKVEGALQEQADTILAGSGIAGRREQTMIAFEQLLGSTEAATEYLEQVRELANRTNYAYDDITGYTKSMLSTFNKEDILNNLLLLSDATAALNWSGSDVEEIISVMNKMNITDKITAMQANQFAGRNLQIYDALAEGKGVDVSKVPDLISKGEISGTEATQYILDYINREFGGLSDKQALSYEGLVDNLSDVEADIQARIGDAYNDARKPMIQAQIDWKSGDGGDEYAEVFAQASEVQARIENVRDQMEMDAYDAVMNGIVPDSFQTEDAITQLGRLAERYQELQEIIATQPEDSTESNSAMLEQAKLLQEAKIMAMNEYNASEGAQLLQDGNGALLEAVQMDTALNGAYYNASLKWGEQISEGLTSAVMAWEPPVITVPVTLTYDAYDEYNKQFAPSAYGMDYVPYDGFPAILHEGERVLTAQQARQQDAGSGGAGAPIININLTGATVRQDSDIPALANAVAAEFLKVWDIAR